jgi:cytochrome c553
MKLLRLNTAVLSIVFSAVCSLAGHAESHAVRNCTWCHGTSAQGYLPAPRLAGQRLQYLENQLVGFRKHTRDNPFSKQYMWFATENLGSQSAHDLAIYFSRLSPKPAEDGNPQLAAMGRKIYQDGVPDSNIVACIACHGPRAEGVREIPRLGGLAFSYLQRRLEQWGEGYNKTARHPMPHVASQLSAKQIAALASYLSFIK